MTTVKTPVRTYTDVPKPVKAAPIQAPVRAPEPAPERELVPLKRKEGEGRS